MSDSWTDGQNDAIVADYFAMLVDDVAGRPYNKTNHDRRLQAHSGRRGRHLEGLLPIRHQAGPEIIELHGVEESRGPDDAAGAQFQEPGIGIGIGPAVTRRTIGVEMHDHRVTVGIELTHLRP